MRAKWNSRFESKSVRHVSFVGGKDFPGASGGQPGESTGGLRRNDARKSMDLSSTGNSTRPWTSPMTAFRRGARCGLPIVKPPCAQTAPTPFENTNRFWPKSTRSSGGEKNRSPSGLRCATLSARMRYFVGLVPKRARPRQKTRLAIESWKYRQPGRLCFTSLEFPFLGHAMGASPALAAGNTV